MHMQLEEMEATPETIKVVQLLRTGRFSHGMYGNFDITNDTLRSLKRNFDTNVRRVKLAVDYFHDAYEEAAGWITNLELRNSDNELWITVDWTQKAQDMILAKEVRYISADLDFEYEDSETRVQYGATLLGAGLTNRPHIKDMKALLSEFKPEHREQVKLLLNDKPEVKKMAIAFDDILAAVAVLNDDQKAQLAEKLGTFKAAEGAKLADAVKEVTTLKAQLAEKETGLKKANDDITAINEKLATTEKKAEFDVMLADGKVVEGQRAAYMKGDFSEFAKNAVAVNLEEAGSGSNGNDDSTAEADKAMVQLDEAAAAIAKSKGVSMAAAYKQARAENPKLAEAIKA